MGKLISRLLTNEELLKGDLYRKDGYRSADYGDGYYHDIKSEAKKEGEVPISYKDWDITVAAGKNPIEQTKKYWRYMADARAKEEAPLNYIDWIYQEDSKLAKASGDKDFQERVERENSARKMRFNLRTCLILTGLMYMPEVFKVFFDFSEKSEKNLDLTMDDFFLDL